MNIFFVSAETAPYSMVGGLSQVTYFLAKALIKLGHDVRIFTPLYGCSSNSSNPSISSPKFIFFENKFYFGSRQKIYGYQDDPTRFAAFGRGCLDWLLRLAVSNSRLTGYWFPDVIHCHDWHTGMLIHWLKNDPKYFALKNIPALYTVHNFSYTGLSTLPTSPKSPNFSKFVKSLQPPLSLGLLSADLVNTVSPTYAREIKTVKKLTGILNGLDTEEFNPSTDKNIAFNYSASVIASPAVAGRGNLFSLHLKNKIYLQKLFSLPINFPNFPNHPQFPNSSPLLAFSGRLVPQKGIDLMLKILPRILKTYPRVQFICLGDGENKYKLALKNLKKRFPYQVGLYLKSNFQKPRQIFAGADIMLIPSKFEPCGIVALEALRYGCVPLVNRTGGLNDIVTDFNSKTEKGWGFSFSALSAKFPNSPNFPNSFASALTSAIKLFQDKPKWNKLVQNCLTCDFSWVSSALEYEKLYQKLLQN